MKAIDKLRDADGDLPHSVGDLEEAMDKWEKKQGRMMSREEFGERLAYIQSHKPGYSHRLRRLVGKKMSEEPVTCDTQTTEAPVTKGSRMSRFGRFTLAV